MIVIALAGLVSAILLFFLGYEAGFSRGYDRGRRDERWIGRGR